MPLREVQPRDGIEGVEVRPHDIAEVGGREYRDVCECVHRPAADDLPWFDIDGLTPRGVHQDKRVEVDVRLDADFICVLLVDWVDAVLCHCTCSGVLQIHSL